MIKKILIFSYFLIFVFAVSANADIIYLTNGDQVSGEFIEETRFDIMMETPGAGRVRIDKKFIERRVKTRDIGKPLPEPVQKMPTEGKVRKSKKEKVQEGLKQAAVDQDLSRWEKKISVGYTQVGGNTQSNQINAEVHVQRMTDIDQTTARATTYISRQNDKTDAKKFYGLTQYDRKFHKDGQGYHFYKMEADQDRFANINYRLAPGLGFGYWFTNEADLKFKGEASLGAQYTNYRDNTENNTDAIFAPRAFLDAKLFSDVRLAQDITYYSSLEDRDRYRIHSETSIINPMTDHVAWKLSFVDDYNNDPAPGKKYNDYRLVSGVDVNF